MTKHERQIVVLTALCTVIAAIIILLKFYDALNGG